MQVRTSKRINHTRLCRETDNVTPPLRAILISKSSTTT